MKELKKRRLAEELKTKILSLLPGSSIKVKTSGDVLLVSLVKVMENSRQIEVRHADG